MLLALAFSACSKKQGSVDLTDLIKQARELAVNKMSKSTDGFGMPFIKSKPWIVYDRFYLNYNLFSRLCESPQEYYSEEKKIYPIDSTFQIDKSLNMDTIDSYKDVFKAYNNYYLVRVIKPVGIGTNKYKTTVWLKDYRWASGFHIYCEFVVEDNKAKVTRIMNNTMTDVVENEENETN
jgi:hypothetical protein